jgi:hypothetical protein
MACGYLRLHPISYSDKWYAWLSEESKIVDKFTELWYGVDRVFPMRYMNMAVSYKRLQHLMIDRDVSNAELMRRAKISANIITKIKAGQYMALDKVGSICRAMNCTPNDILGFTENPQKDA